jgi:mevalonate kinase
MHSFRSMREETEIKMKSGKELEEKLEKRLKVLNDTDEEYKLSLAKAHLVFEEYKKVFDVLKVTLPQKEKDAFLAKEKVKKDIKSLEEQQKKNEGLDKDTQVHNEQLEMLKKLEQQLKAQLGE